MAKLRLGIADSLEGRPLSWGFLRGHHNDVFEAQLYPPSRVSELIRQGEVDAGLIPTPHLLGLPSVRLVPDLCVSTRDADSPLLLCNVPPEDVERVAIDFEPSGAAALLEIVYRQRYGFLPELVPQRGRVEEIPRGFDAALLVAEAALRAPWSSPHGIRLAKAWCEWTELPWVSAVWAVHPRAATADLTFYFKSSLRYGLSSLDILAREVGTEHGARSRRVLRYLKEQLGFLLREDELKGLERLLAERGEVASEKVPELVFL